jgi:two-component system, cell cycle sensor histidine kinase and response regulator CckA
MRILVADEHDQDRCLLENLLGGLGHEVASAPNGREALALLKRGGFGAVVSDIGMPEMDGFQLCRGVRADAELHGLPFVFYTSTYSAAKDAKVAYSLGADGFLVKPMETEAFVQKFFEFIRKAEADPGRSRDLTAAAEKRMCPGPGQEEIDRLKARIGELEQSLAAVRESETRYREIFQQTGDAVAVFVPRSDGRYSFEGINRAAEVVLGLQNERVQGRTTGEVLDPERAEFVNGLIKRVLQSGEPVTVDDTVTVGSTRSDFSSLYVPIRNVQGNICRVVCISRGAAAMRRSAERRFESQKVDALGRLAGGVAHDFNNFIGAIMGNAELLSLDVPPEHPAGLFVAEIMRASERARDFVQQILVLSRRPERPRRPVDLGAAAKGALVRLRKTLSPDVALSVDLEIPCPPILADVSMLQLMVTNLVAVAYRSMPVTGGRITVSLREVEGVSVVSTAPEGPASGRCVGLVVTETGGGLVGVDPSVLFDPFCETKEHGRSTGLGLAIVRSIVIGYNGTVVVESDPEKGTRFEVRFPVCPDSSAAFNPP